MKTQRRDMSDLEAVLASDDPKLSIDEGGRIVTVEDVTRKDSSRREERRDEAPREVADLASEGRFD